MVFHDLRYDGGEMKTIYRDYRGVHYCEVRERSEPGYTKLNGMMGGPIELGSRRKFSNEIIGRCLENQVNSILDYGGDRGQFIPEVLGGAKRYVYEVSGVKPVAGAQGVTSPADHAPYGFLMCCHVLEHVPYPMDLVREFRGLLAPNGLLYVELPIDLGVKGYASMLAGRPLGVDAFVRMHEHLNFFTVVSTLNMLRLAGFTPIHHGIRALHLGWTSAIILGCLAKNCPPGDKGLSPPTRLMPELLAVFIAKVRKKLRV
jgi:SAM-dependent methyltransferase